MSSGKRKQTQALGLSLRQIPTSQSAHRPGSSLKCLSFHLATAGDYDSTTPATPFQKGSVWAAAIAVWGKEAALAMLRPAGRMRGVWNKLARVTSNKFRRLPGWVKTPWSLIQTGHEIGKKVRQQPACNLSDWQCNIWSWNNVSSLSLGTKTRLMQTDIWHSTPPQQPSQLLQAAPLFLHSLNQWKQKGTLSGQVNPVMMIPRKAQQWNRKPTDTSLMETSSCPSFLSQLSSYQFLIAPLQKCSDCLTQRDWGNSLLLMGTHNFGARHKIECQMMCPQKNITT